MLFKNNLLLILGICLVFVITLTQSEKVRYDNYHVYKVTPNTIEKVKLLSDLDSASDSLIFLEGVQVINKDIDIIVAPHKIADFIQALNQNNIQYQLIDSNAQTKLDHDEENRLQIRGRFKNSYSWKVYHTLEETYDWLKSLAEKYPNHIELIKGGTTYEGRDILGVKLSKKSGNKGVFIEGGIHAREWISPATVTYILNELLTNNNPDIQNLADNYDWYFFPHTNPDGYVYTHKTNRLWRKTRSRNGLCYGADPNRNWDFHWNEVGSSSLACSDTYAGTKAFSEIETKSLAEYLKTIQGNIQTYISFHSFSQLLLFPYGHTKTHAPNHNDLKQIADITMKTLSKRYGTKYTGGNIYEAIYPASGASVDWAYGVLNIPLSYCYELRPASGGWDGFVLPENQIIPTGEETLDSIVALLNEAKQLKYY